MNLIEEFALTKGKILTIGFVALLILFFIGLMYYDLGKENVAFLFWIAASFIFIPLLALFENYWSED